MFYGKFHIIIKKYNFILSSGKNEISFRVGLLRENLICTFHLSSFMVCIPTQSKEYIQKENSCIKLCKFFYRVFKNTRKW